MKELEALYKIGTIPLQKNNSEWTTLSSRDEYKELLKALTPPTSDEVCKALSEYLREKITYNSESFFNERETAEVCAIGNHGLIYFNVHLPLNIASDIIKFYEGLEKWLK